MPVNSLVDVVLFAYAVVNENDMSETPSQMIVYWSWKRMMEVGSMLTDYRDRQDVEDDAGFGADNVPNSAAEAGVTPDLLKDMGLPEDGTEVSNDLQKRGDYIDKFREQYRHHPENLTERDYFLRSCACPQCYYYTLLIVLPLLLPFILLYFMNFVLHLPKDKAVGSCFVSRQARRWT